MITKLMNDRAKRELKALKKLYNAEACDQKRGLISGRAAKWEWALNQKIKTIGNARPHLMDLMASSEFEEIDRILSAFT